MTLVLNKVLIESNKSLNITPDYKKIFTLFVLLGLELVGLSKVKAGSVYVLDHVIINANKSLLKYSKTYSCVKNFG